MFRHKIDFLRIGKLRRNHKVPLILPIFIIDKNKHPPRRGII